jgi:PmbA protein
MDTLLAKLRKKVDQAEVYQLHSRAVPIEFRAGKLESVKSKESEGQALRVIKSGRLGFSTTTDVTNPSELVKAAVAAMAFGEKVDFAFPAQGKGLSPEVFDRRVAEVSEDRLIEIGEKVIGELQETDPEIAVNLTVVKQLETSSIANTLGLRVEEERTQISVSVEIEKARADDIFMLGDVTQARYLDDLNLDGMAARVIRHLRFGARVVPVPSKKLPVVFTPNGAITLLLPLVFGLNGKSVHMGISPLKGRVGETVLDPRFSIADDATLSRGVRSSGFDDEGMSASKNPLVGGGVLRGFLYDLQTAASVGTQSTGNGYRARGFRSPPDVGTSHLCVGEGEISWEKMIAEIKEGLLVDFVLGLGQGNISSGEFSNNVAVAFKIEGGKVVGRVKDTMIAGNVYDLLKNHLIAVGDRPQWANVRLALHTPPIAVDAVSVVSRGV